MATYQFGDAAGALQFEKLRYEKPAPEAPKGYERLETRADKSIDSVVLFGGPHGVRLRPNTHGEIHHHILSGRDVVIEVTIDSQGNVVETKIVQAIGHGIDEKIEATLRQWHYQPATLDGVPVASRHDVHFHFPS